LRSGAVIPWEIDAAFHAAMVGWFAPIIGTVCSLLSHPGALGDDALISFGVTILGPFLWFVTLRRTYSAARRWVTWHTDPQQLVIEAANEAVGRGRDGVN
jgi:uncharacterized RDD family membrane protein YckC